MFYVSYYATSINQTYSSLGYLQNIVYVISEVEEWLVLHYDRDVLFTQTQGRDFTRLSATHSECSQLLALSCSDSSRGRFWHRGLGASATMSRLCFRLGATS